MVQLRLPFSTCHCNPAFVHGRRRLADPRLRRALGSLARSGVERGNPLLHGVVSGGSAWTTPYHYRMPAPLRGPDFDAWLDGSLGANALRPAAESALREWPAARRVNGAGVGDYDPTIIERVDAA